MIFSDYSPKALAAIAEHPGHSDVAQKILVPVDFSECADNALRFAVAIALRNGATLKLLHSVQLPLQTTEIVGYPINDLEKEAVDHLAKKSAEINQWLEQQRLPKIEIMHTVAIGFAAEEIAKAAVDNEVDLIVMGTYGAGRVAGMILGSIASSVLQHVKCPVLIVPENVEYSGFKRIAYATDMREVNRPAVQSLVEFSRRFNAELHLLHVLKGNDTLTPEQANAFKNQFDKAAHYDKLSYHIIDAEQETIVNVVDEYMDSNDIEILAMLTHNRGFFDRLFHPSLTKRFALHAHKTLLAFH
jgi:nucleotide-binding universal stress UspA family protein